MGGNDFFIWVIVSIIVGGAISAAFAQANVTSPGRELHAKFISLGTIAGKSQAEIVAVVGAPTAVSALPGGRTLLQWQATGCHMALRFNGQICEGITHQSLSK